MRSDAASRSRLHASNRTSSHASSARTRRRLSSSAEGTMQRSRSSMAVAFVALLFLAMYLVSLVNLRQSVMDAMHTTGARLTKKIASTTIVSEPASSGEPGREKVEETRNDALVLDFKKALRTEDGRAPPDVTAKVENCRLVRDYGLVEVLQQSAEVYCQEPARGDSLPSTYTYYHSDGAAMRSTHFQNLRVDLRKSKVHKPIRSMAQDGGNHDPRFRYTSITPECSCATIQNHANGHPRVWNSMMALDPEKGYTVCTNTSFANAVAEPSVPDSVTTFTGTNLILLARKDDHNPFFQISATLNAWIMMQAVGWTAETTQLVYFDKGYASPVDALQKAILSPNHRVISGSDLFRRVVHFDSLLVAPYEYSGPMMQHLDNMEPCYHSDLIADFRALALSRMQVSQDKAELKTCTITVISRRNYGGRIVQRRWRNEDEVMAAMRKDYAADGVGDSDAPPLYRYGECLFQSIDFVDLSISQQMKIMIESDVVISMHGAGLANVMWTRPETVVVEIFPRRKKRWGYRNLCQFLGCAWHEFRGGQDIRLGGGREPNANDKTIPYDEWKAFFDPLLRATVRALETRVETLIGH